MSNIDLARVLMAAMYHLACMTVFFIRGEIDPGREEEEKFNKLFAAVSGGKDGAFDG